VSRQDTPIIFFSQILEKVYENEELIRGRGEGMTEGFIYPPISRNDHVILIPGCLQGKF
jgi:hypothetical protein